jgi:hypothetical protein
MSKRVASMATSPTPAAPAAAEPAVGNAPETRGNHGSSARTVGDAESADSPGEP